MRLLKESVLQIWRARKATVREDRDGRAYGQSHPRQAGPSDEVFLFDRSIDIEKYTATPRNCARSSRLRGSTVTQVSSKNST